MLPIAIRPAQRKDSAAIARLFLLSSDGLAAYIWAQLAGADESLEAVGARRYAREGVDFSYENCLVATDAGRGVVGMAHAFPMGRRLPGAVESDPVLAPYAALEEPGSLYLSGLAVEKELRGCGIGRRLMAATAARAPGLGLGRLSLICFEHNRVALALYRDLGFVERDRRPVVPHPSLSVAGGDALLLSAPAAAIRRAAGARAELALAD